MIHINKFIDKLQGFEARGQKDYIMPIKDAKDLHADITRLLLTLEELRSNKVSKSNTDTDIVTVEMTGGSY